MFDTQAAALRSDEIIKLLGSEDDAKSGKAAKIVITLGAGGALIFYFVLLLLMVYVANDFNRLETIKSCVIPSLLKMLEVSDNHRPKTSELLREFSLHGGSLFCYVLTLLMVKIEKTGAPIFESNAIQSLVNMLEKDDDDLRDTAAKLLQTFALHGGLLVSSVLSILTVTIENIPSKTLNSVVPSLIKMLRKKKSESIRDTAADLLHEFALHGGTFSVPSCTC